MGDAGCLAERTAALAVAVRALVNARAPRRTVAATAAAVAQALFGGPGLRRPQSCHDEPGDVAAPASDA
eukprot:8684556-Heterocapsa_arctica.AAC.1